MADKATCIVRDCDASAMVVKYRLCQLHYHRWHRLRDNRLYRPLPWLEVQMAERDRSTCWVWPHNLSQSGYGTLRVDGRNRRATHMVFELLGTPVPDGQIVRHKCDNPPCVNPDHLELGDKWDNAIDSVKRGRHPHQKLTEADVRQIDASLNEFDGYGACAALARQYGVTPAAITRIKAGKNWAWVTKRGNHKRQH